MILFQSSIFIIFTLIYQFQAQYVPPQALVEPLKPVGIRISIPHEEGISLVAFHVNFNTEFEGLDAGTIARDIIRQRNGRWTYQDRSTKLKENDMVYYWIHVVYNNLGYNLLNQEHKVTDFYDYDGNKINFNENRNKPNCVQSITKVLNQTGVTENLCAGALIFEDDFKDLTNFQQKQWTVLQQFSNEPDSEFVVYRNSPKNININSGLVITPRLLLDEYDDNFIRAGELQLDKCTGRLNSDECSRKARGWYILPPISSSRINTKAVVNFQYGRVEIKAKFPRGDWIFPLLMLEPASNAGAEVLQIRIASSAGNAELKLQNGKDVSGHNIWGGVTTSAVQKPQSYQDRTMKYDDKLWSDDYHTYELIWNPNRITLKVDGLAYSDKQISLLPNTPYYLTLGLAVGGTSEFQDYSISQGYSKPWRNVEAKALSHFYNAANNWYKTWQGSDTSLRVEHVKIWAL